jgi:hypothetical protein
MFFIYTVYVRLCNRSNYAFRAEQIVMGAVAVVPMSQSNISDTFTQDFIDKLPLSAEWWGEDRCRDGWTGPGEWGGGECVIAIRDH